jgi:hypothetical protein
MCWKHFGGQTPPVVLRLFVNTASSIVSICPPCTTPHVISPQHHHITIPPVTTPAAHRLSLFALPALTPPPQWAKGPSLSRTHNHTQTHHIRYDYPGRVISPSQRHLSDNTQHSQQTDMPPVGLEPAIPAGERDYDCAELLSAPLSV